MHRTKRTAQQTTSLSLWMGMLCGLLGLGSACHTRDGAGGSGSFQTESLPQLESDAGIAKQSPDGEDSLVVFLPDRTVELAPNASGPLQSLRVRLGQDVAEGELLATLDARKTQAERTEQEAVFSSMQTECEARRSEQQFAEKQRARHIGARGGGGVSEIDVERAEQEAIRSATRTKQCEQDLEQKRARLLVLDAELARAVVRAPFRGRIADLYATPGATIQSGQPLIRLVGSGPVLVRLAVPPHHQVRESQRICLRHGERQWAIQVTRVAPEVDEAMGMRVVEARVLSDSHPAPQGLRVSISSACSPEHRT